MTYFKVEKKICYSINVLQSLKDSGYSLSRIRKEHLLGESTLQKIRDDKPISMTSLEILCGLLDMQPGHIIEYR